MRLMPITTYGAAMTQGALRQCAICAWGVWGVTRATQRPACEPSKTASARFALSALKLLPGRGFADAVLGAFPCGLAAVFRGDSGALPSQGME